MFHRWFIGWTRGAAKNSGCSQWSEDFLHINRSTLNKSRTHANWLWVTIKTSSRISQIDESHFLDRAKRNKKNLIVFRYSQAFPSSRWKSGFLSSQAFGSISRLSGCIVGSDPWLPLTVGGSFGPWNDETIFGFPLESPLAHLASTGFVAGIRNWPVGVRDPKRSRSVWVEYR